MDKVIVTVLLIVAGVVTTLAVFNGIYPAINRSTGAITNATVKISDRIESRIEIIHVGDNGNTVETWIKNVGTSDIFDIGRSDVFFGTTDNFTRVTYGGSTPPYWNYQLEGGHSEWRPTVTAKITIYLASAPSANTYLLKVVIPNGIFDETTFGVD